MGQEYCVNGVLDFKTHDLDALQKLKPPTTYRTVFGPAVGHDGVIYSKNDINLQKSFFRRSRARWPDRPGEHQRARDRQTAYIKEHCEFFDDLAVRYLGAFEGFLGALAEARIHHDDPHVKRLLRINAMKELTENALFVRRGWLQFIVYKMKTDEIAKFGKYPRAIGDLGVVASLLGFQLTKRLKYAQSRTPIHLNGGVAEFIASPQGAMLLRVFENLINPSGRFYYAYFSDDSCLSLRVGGRIYMFNIDIKGCDLSHGPEMFRRYVKMYPKGLIRDEVQGLVDQCSADTIIRSTLDKSKFVRLRNKEPFLASGSTITTSLNNLACIAMIHAISRVDFTDCTREEAASKIQAATLEVGYQVTIDICEIPEDLQFLKHSPVRDVRGRWKPLLNIGVLLRMSGTCRGDLPGRGDLRERGLAFQSALLQGAYPHVDFPLIRRLKHSCSNYQVSRKCQERIDTIVDQLLAYKVDEPVSFSCTSESAYMRYRLTPSEILHLDAEFGSSTFGDVTCNLGLHKVLQIDYQIGCLT